MTRSAPRVVATGVGFAEGPLSTPDGDTYVTSITHGRHRATIRITRTSR